MVLRGVSISSRITVWGAGLVVGLGVELGSGLGLGLSLGWGSASAAEVAPLGGAPAATSAPASVDRRRSHWAFQPVRTVLPPVVMTDIGGHPTSHAIDAFIAERLKGRGLPFPGAASRRALIRRVTYDLTGLPPTPEVVEAFVHDPSPQAWEHLVDRLLESPHYRSERAHV